MVTRFARFVVAGAVNTLLTYGLYLLLLLVMPYLWAYVTTYLAGIAIGYLMNATWVFRRGPSVRTAAVYPLVYLLNLAFGTALLALLVEVLGVPRKLAPIIVLALSIPLTFVLTRGVFQRGVPP